MFIAFKQVLSSSVLNRNVSFKEKSHLSLKCFLLISNNRKLNKSWVAKHHQTFIQA
jgi:hypothetical protein